MQTQRNQNGVMIIRLMIQLLLRNTLTLTDRNFDRHLSRLKLQLF